MSIIISISYDFNILEKLGRFKTTQYLFFLRFLLLYDIIVLYVDLLIKKC